MLNAPHDPILSVSALTRLIKQQLESRFIAVWVEGEASNLKMPSSGHLYFTLKDESAQLRAVLFRSSGRSVKFVPKDGQQVLCRGRVSVYEPRGEYQIVIDYIEPRGVGALQAAFEQLKERLQKEGLFDPLRKKPLPALPRRIGIVTSPTGAAIRDMLKVMSGRGANLEIVINPVPVQGEGAAAAIASAIDELNDLGGFDLLIIGRGGGSLEDLWAFNEEVVARAISRSRVPVVSAVGHEVDYTISDFVADLRAPTPTAAAEMVVRARRARRDQVEFQRVRLDRGMQHGLEMTRSRLRAVQRSFRDPRRLVEAHLLRLDELEVRIRRGLFNTMRHQAQRLRHVRESLGHRSPVERLHRLATQTQELVKRFELQTGFYLRQKRNRLDSLLTALDGLGPLAILSRGYSVTRTLPEMRLLKEAQGVNPGTRVHVRLHRGALICRVEETEGSSDGPIQI
ncbi:MAG TPA: exodeoxyribonuclease VII large subunit [Nitrospiria bacterium]|nr:exodeoxyribonuclease VII large subunit [Nitrospiria bacterium]